MPDPSNSTTVKPTASSWAAKLPLLTITIPTYNRAQYVEKLVKDLQREISSMEPSRAGQIEIIASNNNSTDNTAQVLERLKGEVPSLVVINQPRNVGPYENMLTLMAHAKGDWIWLHGDDDVSDPLGLTRLLRLIQNNEVDYIITYDSRFNKPFKGEFRGRMREFIRFCAETEPYLLLEYSLITSNIFRKGLLNPDEMRRRNDTDYGHFYALMGGGLATDARVCVPDFGVFHIPEERPPFECWPKNIDQSWRDYLAWLSEKSGVKIDIERAMDYNRRRLQSELKNPLQFIRKNYLNLFRPGAYPFLVKRLLTLFFKRG